MFTGWTLSWKVPEHEPEQATELSAELRVLDARALSRARARALLLLPDLSPCRNRKAFSCDFDQGQAKGQAKESAPPGTFVSAKHS